MKPIFAARAMLIRRAALFFRRALALRCPECGTKPVFIPLPRVRSLRDWLTPLDGCPRCGYAYERETGYFLLATWGVNYGAGCLLGLSIALVLETFFFLPLPVLLISVILPPAVFNILFARHAKAIFLAFDHFFDPHLQDGGTDGGGRPDVSKPAAPRIPQKSPARGVAPMLRVVVFFTALALSTHPSSAQSPDTIGRPAHGVDTTGRATRLKVEFAGATDNVKIVQLPDGALIYVLKRPGTGNDRVLTPDEFTRLYFSQQSGRGWLSVIFNITSPVGLAWIALGLGGQLLFTGRMLLQWIASEKHQRSVIPVAFWWMSLIGASMLLAYFVWRRDVVGILGQATGWFIYIRNLVLIHRSRS